MNSFDLEKRVVVQDMIWEWNGWRVLRMEIGGRYGGSQG